MHEQLYVLCERVEELIEVAVESRGRARRRLARLYTEIDELGGELETRPDPSHRARRALSTLRSVTDHMRRLPRLSGEAGAAIWENAGASISGLGELVRALLQEAVTAALEEDGDRRTAVAEGRPEVDILFDQALAELLAAVLENEGLSPAALKTQRLLHALESAADQAMELANPSDELVPIRKPQVRRS